MGDTTTRETWWTGMGTVDRLRAVVAENDRLNAENRRLREAIEAHRQAIREMAGDPPLFEDAETALWAAIEPAR